MKAKDLYAIKEKEERETNEKIMLLENCGKCGNIAYTYSNNTYHYFCKKLEKKIGIDSEITDSTDCPLFRDRTLWDKLKMFLG